MRAGGGVSPRFHPPDESGNRRVRTRGGEREANAGRRFLPEKKDFTITPGWSSCSSLRTDSSFRPRDLSVCRSSSEPWEIFSWRASATSRLRPVRQQERRCRSDRPADLPFLLQAVWVGKRVQPLPGGRAFSPPSGDFNRRKGAVPPGRSRGSPPKSFLTARKLIGYISTNETVCSIRCK